MKTLVSILLVVVMALCGTEIYIGLKYKQLENWVAQNAEASNLNTDIQQKEILILQKRIKTLEKRKPIIVLVVPDKNKDDAPSDAPSNWTQASNEHIRFR